MEYILLIIGAFLVNNFVLTRFLGICPFLGVSKDLNTAMGMGAAVIFVITFASMVTWALQYLILVPLGAAYLQTIAFILVIATFVQFVELVLKKSSPGLHKSLGIFLPLITTNCAVLGVTVLNVQKEYTFLKSTAFGFGASVGKGCSETPMGNSKIRDGMSSMKERVPLRSEDKNAPPRNAVCSRLET